MNKQGKTVAVLLVLAITASGCIEGGGSDETTVNPIQVNTFEAIPQPAFADRQVSINMELQNTGELEAKNAVARVFGPAFARDSGQDNAWRDRDGNSVNIGYRTKELGNLRAGTENNPAIPKQKTWTFTAPALSENRRVDYNFRSKIFYQYETSGETDFRIMSAERFQERDISRSDATIETTPGPIQLDIRGITPKLYDGDSPALNSEICVRVINEGEGTPFLAQEAYDDGSDRKYNVQDDDENKINLSIENIGPIGFDSDPDTSNIQNEGITVDMPRGKRGFQCFNMVERGTGLSPTNPERNINAEVEVEYGYLKEDTTAVTVEGTRLASGNN